MAQSVAMKLAAEAGLAHRLHFDSTGTHASHRGERPDRRAALALSHRGYELVKTRSRRIELADFENFDHVLAMDAVNLAAIHRLAPPAHSSKVRLFMSFAEDLNETEIPDPYFGNAEGFDRVLDLCEAGARGLIKHYAL